MRLCVCRYVCVSVCSCTCSAEGKNCDKFVIALELIQKSAQDARACEYSDSRAFERFIKEGILKQLRLL